MISIQANSFAPTWGSGNGFAPTLSDVNLEGAKLRGAHGLDLAIVNDIRVGPASTDHLVGAAARDWLLRQR